MKIITAVLLLLSAFGVQAEWVFFTKNVSGSTYYVDFSTIKKTAVGYRVWELVNYAKRKNGIYSLENLIEYDCSEERSRFLKTSYFSEPMGEGTIVLIDSSPAPWSYVSPQSASETLLKAVCSRVNSR
jgi:hypothetical protein